MAFSPSPSVDTTCLFWSVSCAACFLSSFCARSLFIFPFCSFLCCFFFYPESDRSRHSPSPRPQDDAGLCIYIDRVAGNLVLVALPLASPPLCSVWFGFSPVISPLSLANVQDTTAYFAKISLSQLFCPCSLLPPGSVGNLCLYHEQVLIYCLNQWRFSANGEFVSPVKTLLLHRNAV